MPMSANVSDFSPIGDADPVIATLVLRDRVLSLNHVAQSNEEGTVLSSSARTADTQSSDFENCAAGGIAVTLDITVNGSSETITIYLQMKCPVTGNYVNVTNSGALNTAATGTYVWLPSVPLPKIFRFNYDKSAGNSVTFSSGYSYTRHA